MILTLKIDDKDLKKEIKKLVAGELKSLVRNEINASILEEIKSKMGYVKDMLTKTNIHKQVNNVLQQKVRQILGVETYWGTSEESEMLKKEAKRVAKEITEKHVKGIVNKIKVSPADIKKKIVDKLTDKMGL